MYNVKVNTINIFSYCHYCPPPIYLLSYRAAPTLQHPLPPLLIYTRLVIYSQISEDLLG